ncbi:hypothetical protein ALQ53_103816 [Pseudomonas cannabina]|uniref:Uncharacterized protein n=1 Tax=Pseudomonas cannabina TaxID=86840 RepID=A0A0N8QXF4_PSECA|nr:Unknown protein sequence [Pseudomonas syringae pv. maculicola]KPW72638.1 hypothetical protein ALO81_102461 [Pseudomonas cannabina]RMN81270.1 hypothetical protein ALQ53_103816 [Pseudomonas cannabina]
MHLGQYSLYALTLFRHYRSWFWLRRAQNANCQASAQLCHILRPARLFDCCVPHCQGHD